MIRRSRVLVAFAVMFVVAGVGVPILLVDKDESVTKIDRDEVVQLLILNSKATDIGDDGAIRSRVSDEATGDTIVVHQVRGDWSISVPSPPPDVSGPLRLAAIPTRDGGHTVLLEGQRCAEVSWFSEVNPYDCAVSMRTPSYAEFTLHRTGEHSYEGRLDDSGQVVFILQIVGIDDVLGSSIKESPNSVIASTSTIRVALGFVAADPNTRFAISRSLQIAAIR